MNQHPDQHTTKDNVLSLIREGKVSMRPASLFKIEYLAILLLSAVVLLISIALAGYIFFALRVNGHDALLGFGTPGALAFLRVFPWGLFVLDIAFIFLLSKLIREFAFGYRRPVLGVLLVLFVGATVFAFVIDRETPLHDELMHEGEHGFLPPPVGGWYEHARGPAPHDAGIYRGIVTDITPPIVTMQHDDLDADGDEASYRVLVPKGTDAATVHVGDHLYVFGPSENGIIHAIGLRNLAQ